MSKLYYGVLSKSLENLDIERYYSILYFLNSNNGCTQQHICNNLAIDKTAMVKVIDTLVEGGYVTKKVNPGDRRQHFVNLTKKGQKYTGKIVHSFEAIDQEIFASVSARDLDVFNRVLCRLSNSLRELPANNLLFNYKKSGSSRNTPTLAKKDRLK